MQYIKKALNYIEKNMVYPKAMLITGCPTNPEVIVNDKKLISFAILAFGARQVKILIISFHGLKIN